ncbi:MAG: LysM peptidoglycan-binding domain-containing protein [Bacteriovoracaceae bacterium]|jgi:membrane-bound lytic murein transglycosylase D|nr:hypothetical protein [Halobacteriovoraceae bacterium]MDP7319927.1 LysM peptidoglycan-binding domain-containing protein [Bacteriovoracaceae bacterium]
MVKNKYLNLGLVFLLSGCAQIVPNYKYKQKSTPHLTKKSPSEVINSYKDESLKNELSKTIAKGQIKTADQEFLQKVSSKKVKFWINYFTTKNKDRLERFISNGEQYRPIIEEVFAEYGLPKELYYVGIVESGYINRARSHAGAVGPWQFMKATAQRYGLRVNSVVDERKNIYKSTQAAALLFQDLYNIFGSWELALAGYNAGEYGVIRRIRGADTRDYYELSSRKILPKETRHYVPKVLAVMSILENPNHYKINIKKPNSNPYIKAKKINIKHSVSLSVLAKKLNTSVQTIKAFNHDLKTDHIPSLGQKGFDLFLPNLTQQKIAKLNKFFKTRPKHRAYASSHNFTKIHRVQKNESIYALAKRYGTSIRKIKRVNKLRSNTIYVGQKLRLPNTANTKTLYSYKVRKGDNLSHIAMKFRTNIRKLKKLNRLKRSRIYVGQKLKVPPHRTYYYTVKKGDYLSRIARNNQQSLSELRRLNRITNRIYPGQKLIVKIEKI